MRAAAGSIFNRSKTAQSNAYKDILKVVKKIRSIDAKNKNDPHREEESILSNLPQNIKSCSHTLFVVNEFWLNHIQSLTDLEINEVALTLYCHLYSSSEATARQLLLKSNEMNVPSHILKIFTVAEYTIRQITASDYDIDSHDKLVEQLKQLGDIHTKYEHISDTIYESILDAFHFCLEQKFNKIYSMENRFCFTQFYRLMVDMMNDNEYLSQHLTQTDAFLGSLEDCLDHKDGSVYFKMFLQEQLQDENYLFYKAVQEYKAHQTIQRIESGAHIIDMYVKTSGDKQVNLSSSTRKQILNIIKVTSKMEANDDTHSLNAVITASKKSNIDIMDMVQSNGFSKQLFDKAHQEIFTLMQRNSWNEFRNKILEYCGDERFDKQQEIKLKNMNDVKLLQRDLVNALKTTQKNEEAQEISDEKNDHKQLREEIDDLTEENSKLQNKIENLEENKSKFELLKREKSQLQNEIADLRQKEHEMKILREETNALQNKNIALNSKLMQSDSLKEENDRLENKISELKQSLAGIESLEEENVNLKDKLSQIGALKQEISRLKRSADEWVLLKQGNASLQQEITELKSNEKQLRQSKIALIQATSLEMDSLRNLIATYTREIHQNINKK